MQRSGLLREQKFSRNFHSSGVPVLVSPSLLRSRGLGQLDLVTLNKKKFGWVLEVGEVKSSEVGLENMQGAQLRRLRDAQNFLAGVFGLPTRFHRLYLEKEFSA